MVILKIRGGSLIEAVVASVILVIVFTIASLTLNNSFKSVISTNDSQMQYRVDELSYLLKNDAIQLPFYEETNLWDIEVFQAKDSIHLDALHKASNNKTRHSFAIKD